MRIMDLAAPALLAAATIGSVVVLAAAPAAAQGIIPTVIGASIPNNSASCGQQVRFDQEPAERRETIQKSEGGTLATFWALAKSDPVAAGEMVGGGKKGGLKGPDGVVHASGKAVLEGVTPLEGPFTLVKFVKEGRGPAARGIWKSVEPGRGETIQTVDFRLNARTKGYEIQRIAITDAGHAAATPDIMCNLRKDAEPLW